MLWALAELFHLLGNPADLARLLVGDISPTSIIAWLSAVAAAIVIANGSRGLAGRPFLILCCLIVVDLFVSAPLVGNHQMILALGSAILVGSLAWSGPDDHDTTRLVLVAKAATGLRWLLLIAYGLIAFSKLNRDFLNPVVSCAVVFGDEMLAWFNLSLSENAAASSVAVYSSLAAELAIPAMLVVRRLRSFGIVLALVFHGLLSLEPSGHVYDFTAVLIPLFLLFAPDEVHQRLSSMVGRVQARLASTVSVAAVVLLLLVALIVLGIGGPAWAIGYPLWLGYLATVVWLAAPPLLGRSRNAGASDRGLLTAARPGPLALAVLAVALLNGASPYLQLKTATAFNMYSNLRVLGPQSNHLIVPAGPSWRTPEFVAVETFQGDDPISFYPEHDLVVPASNLRAYVADSREVQRLSISVRPVDISDAGFSLGPSDPLAGDVVATEQSFVDQVRTRLGQSIGLWRSADIDGPAQCLRRWGPAY